MDNIAKLTPEVKKDSSLDTPRPLSGELSVTLPESLSEPAQTASSQFANYTDSERGWIFAHLCMARGTLGADLDDTSLRVYRKTCELLAANVGITSFTRVPSQKSVTKIWETFESTGKVTGIHHHGGRPKIVRTDVEELLKNTNYSYRRIVKELGDNPVSNSTITRIARSLKIPYRRSQMNYKRSKGVDCGASES